MRSFARGVHASLSQTRTSEADHALPRLSQGWPRADPVRRVPVFRPQLHGLGDPGPAGGGHRQGLPSRPRAEGPDGRHPGPGRGCTAPGQWRAGRPHRPQAHRDDQPTDRADRLGHGLVAGRSQLSSGAGPGSGAGRGGRLVRGRPAAGFAMVSAGASGPGPGHRWGRQLGHRPGGPVRADPGQAFRLAERHRPGRPAAGRGLRRLHAAWPRTLPSSPRPRSWPSIWTF